VVYETGREVEDGGHGVILEETRSADRLRRAQHRADELEERLPAPALGHEGRHHRASDSQAPAGQLLPKGKISDEEIKSVAAFIKAGLK
jgi:hypothetical protein